MATKTTGGSMYSGLLQTNQDLAKAKAEASAGVGKGLAEGFKPLQGYLMGVAAKEQKRLDQLDSDMGIAGAYLGKMTDTAGILGEYEQEVTDFGVTTKNLLNDIAKDESLNQFEKQAKYVEAVNAFNKRVSLYSGDQEIIAGLTGRFANGTISKANDLTGDNYLIGKALAHGNFTVKNGQYSVFDKDKNPLDLQDSNIDSNRIKNLYVTDTKYNFDEISAGYAKIGAAAKTEQELERLVRQAALGFGTKESALAQLVEGDYYEYEAIKDNTLEELQDKIYTAGYNTANQTFHAEKPKIELAGTAKQMGMRIMNTYDSAFNAKNYNAFLGMKFGGDIVSAYEVKVDGKIQFKTTDAKGRLIETSLIDPSNANTRSAILNELINASSGTATQKNDALNFISTYTPPSIVPSSDDPEEGDDPIVNNTNTGLPERITNLSNEPFNIDNRKEYLKEKGLESIDELPLGSRSTTLRNLRTPEFKKLLKTYNIPDSSNFPGRLPKKVNDWLEENKEGVLSERNVAEAFYETGGKTEEEKATAIESEKNALVQKAGNAIADAGIVKLSGDVKSKAISQRSEIKKALEKFTKGDSNNKFKYINMSELTEKQYEIFKYIKQGVDVEELRRLLKYS